MCMWVYLKILTRSSAEPPPRYSIIIHNFEPCKSHETIYNYKPEPNNITSINTKSDTLMCWFQTRSLKLGVWNPEYIFS